MAVKYTTTGDTFSPGKAEAWTPSQMLSRSVLHSFALHPDGERVLGLVLDPTKAPVQKTVSLVFNLLDELRRVAPTGVKR